MSVKEKKEVMNEAMQEQGHEVTKRSIDMLAENGRLTILPGIVEDLDRLVASQNKLVKAKVYSVEELTNKQKSRVEAALKKQVKADESVTVEYGMKPKMMGGIEVHLGEKHLDLSVATRINQIHQDLVANAN